MRSNAAWLDLNDRDLFTQKTIDQIGIGGSGLGFMGDEMITTAKNAVVGKVSMDELLVKAVKARPGMLTRVDVEYLSFFESMMTDFHAGLLPAALQATVRVLVLCYNELTELRVDGTREDPNSFAMDSLLELYASYNKISSIATDRLDRLINLRVLDVRHNLLSVLPVELFSLVNLERLDISENKIEFLHPEIGQLRKLQVFYASNNLLDSLPQELGNVVELRELDVSDNKLRKLPLTMSYLSKLRSISVEENPLREPPRNIISGGAESIVSFLKELMKGGEPCLRMKLMFVGQENVGKTSLLRALASEVKSRGDPKSKDSDAGVSASIQVSGRPVSTDGIGTQFFARFGSSALSHSSSQTSTRSPSRLILVIKMESGSLPLLFQLQNSLESLAS